MVGFLRRDPEFDLLDSMGLIAADDGWKIPDELWEKIEPLLPPGKPHPLGCHNSRVPNRNAMNAILFVLRTGIQWNALNAERLHQVLHLARRDHAVDVVLDTPATPKKRRACYCGKKSVRGDGSRVGHFEMTATGLVPVERKRKARA